MLLLGHFYLPKLGGGEKCYRAGQVGGFFTFNQLYLMPPVGSLAPKMGWAAQEV